MTIYMFILTLFQRKDLSRRMQQNRPRNRLQTPKSSITNARLTDENAEFTLNNAENYETATAYVAEYTENGTLAAVKCQDITIDSAVQKVTVPFAKKNAENSVKIMVWQDMKPLSDAVSLNNSAVPADYMAYYSFDGNYENGGSKSNVTTENVGVTKISNYSGNKVYGGSMSEKRRKPAQTPRHTLTRHMTERAYHLTAHTE